MIALERLQSAAEHAQVAVITHSRELVAECARDWTPTTLERYSPGNGLDYDCPIDFEIRTTTTKPTEV
jgi:hypothetical protein